MPARTSSASAGHQAGYAGSQAQDRQHGARPGAGDAGLVSLPPDAGAASRHGMSSWGWPGPRCRRAWREMIARAGAEVSFGKAAALLADLAGVAVSARTIERSAEASGAAARAAVSAEAALLRARAIRPLPPPEPVPDMLYVEVDGTGVPVRAQRDRRPARQGRGRQSRHPRDQARPVLHRVRPR